MHYDATFQPAIPRTWQECIYITLYNTLSVDNYRVHQKRFSQFPRMKWLKVPPHSWNTHCGRTLLHHFILEKTLEKLAWQTLCGLDSPLREQTLPTRFISHTRGHPSHPTCCCNTCRHCRRCRFGPDRLVFAPRRRRRSVWLLTRGFLLLGR